MLTIKPSTSQSKEPDPALSYIDPANIIFVTDEPKKQPDNKDNDDVQPYHMAKKIQGSELGNTDDKRAATESFSNVGSIDDDTHSSEQDQKFDTTNKALTDEFKKGLKDETIVKDQLLADDSVQEKVSATQALIETTTPEQTELLSQITDQQPEEKKIPEENLAVSIKKHEPVNIIELFNQLAEEKKVIQKQQSEQNVITQIKENAIDPVQKIESKKHRPIDVGLQNQSKLELLKDATLQESSAPKKRKFSLQDLNLGQGFSEFVRQGNANFSADGNSDHDDERGLKLKSYMTQISKMHENACKSYPNKIIIKHQDQVPPQDSIINMIIDRSGQVNLVRLQSSGNQMYDDYHMKVLIFMGNFPPIPKFISDTEHSFPVKSIFFTASSLSAFGSYQPKKLEL